MGQSSSNRAVTAYPSGKSPVSAVDAASLPIAVIYDAALDGSKWPAALAAAARYIGGSSASLWIRNPGILPGDHYHFGGEEDCAARGLAWSHPAAQRHAETMLDLVAEQAATSRGAFLEARLRGQAAAETSGGADGVAYLTVFRRDGSWDAQARRRLRLIVPHFCRAVEMTRLMTIRYAAAIAMADTLDSLNASVFLVDANGETVHANANGEARLAEGRLVRSVRGKLTASAPEAAAALGQAVKYRRAAKFAFTVPGEHRDGGGGCQIGRLFPLAAEVARDRGCHRPVVAGLVLDDAALDASKPVDRIAQHYGLARSERDVLLAVVDGCGLTEAAERLSISHSTLKTYLRRLFGKTGTRRQMDLIRLCAAFRSPFQDR